MFCLLNNTDSVTECGSDREFIDLSIYLSFKLKRKSLQLSREMNRISQKKIQN